MAKLKDSGARKAFSTGAVRDIAEGKGRCDLLPLDVMAGVLQGYECWQQEKNESVAPMPTTLMCVGFFIDLGNVDHLIDAISSFIDEAFSHDIYTALLELAKHYEDGASKYADNNWKLGIDLHCFIDSAIRHYIKWMRGDDDEPHDRAVLWNLVGAVWTYQNKPELNDIHTEDLSTKSTLNDIRKVFGYPPITDEYLISKKYYSGPVKASEISKLAELIGVLEDKPFLIKFETGEVSYCEYRVHEGVFEHRASSSDKFDLSDNVSVLCGLINGIHLPISL